MIAASEIPDSKIEWLATGSAVFAAVDSALALAKVSVCLEIYIFADDSVGRRVRELLIAAARRGCQVQVLVDALGSLPLSDHFWDELRTAGGEVRRFNSFYPRRLPIRDHRKILLIDDSVAFVGGFNLAEEYCGDGVERGWRDVGVRLTGPCLAKLRTAFNDMFNRCVEPERLWRRFRLRDRGKLHVDHHVIEILPTGPGSGPSVFQQRLTDDLLHARKVDLATAYFLPGARLRRRFRQVVKRGGRVRVIVPGISDVRLSQNAGRHLYAGLLRAGVEIYEYQPQMLHAKLYGIDQTVYVGSTNLDLRSLHINYEIMTRLRDASLSREVEHYFDDLVRHSRQIKREDWRAGRSFFEKFREQLSYIILARLDPYLTQWLSRGQH